MLRILDKSGKAMSLKEQAELVKSDPTQNVNVPRVAPKVVVEKKGPPAGLRPHTKEQLAKMERNKEKAVALEEQIGETELDLAGLNESLIVATDALAEKETDKNKKAVADAESGIEAATAHLNQLKEDLAELGV